MLAPCAAAQRRARYRSRKPMSWGSLPLLFVIALLIWLLVSFVREKWSPDVVAAIAVAALLISQILSPSEVLSVLSNSAPVTIACMFVLSAALERTGCIDALGNRSEEHTSE